MTARTDAREPGNEVSGLVGPFVAGVPVLILLFQGKAFEKLWRRVGHGPGLFS